MRAILEFESTGKGAFACRKDLKVGKNVKLTMVRDGMNLKGPFTYMSTMLESHQSQNVVTNNLYLPLDQTPSN